MSLRLDDTGFGNIKIFQDPEEFCYGVDAVLLADFAARNINKSKSSQNNIIDLGCGTGIIPLILSHKTYADHITGVEVQKNSYQIAEKNASLNKLEGKINFIHCNVKDLGAFDNGALKGTFDVVTSNPPYTAENGGLTSGNVAKMIARHEKMASLKDFIHAASELLGDKGDFYMVHRPSRLVDICCLCREEKLEPKEFRFVSGKPMEKPNILLVHCVKNGGRELKFLEPLAIYEENGEYSDEIDFIYEK